jgi:two-component system sensor histidine kinase ChvG
MTLAEGIDVRDLVPRKETDLVLGDDFVVPDRVDEAELTARRARRGWLSMRESSLTRKIVTFNLIALNVLVVGILYLSGSHNTLVQQRADSLTQNVALMSDVVEARLPTTAPVNLARPRAHPPCDADDGFSRATLGRDL